MSTAKSCEDVAKLLGGALWGKDDVGDIGLCSQLKRLHKYGPTVYALDNLLYLDAGTPKTGVPADLIA